MLGSPIVSPKRINSWKISLFADFLPLPTLPLLQEAPTYTHPYPQLSLNPQILRI